MSEKETKCLNCKGVGEIKEDIFLFVWRRRTCPTCRGAGSIKSESERGK